MTTASPELSCTSRLDGDTLHVAWQITNPNDEAIYIFEAPNSGPAYVVAEGAQVEIGRRYIPVEGLGVIAKRAPSVRKLEAGATWVDRFALGLPLRVRDPNVNETDRTAPHDEVTCRAGWFAESDEVAVEVRDDALFPSAHHLESAQKLVESPLRAAD